MKKRQFKLIKSYPNSENIGSVWTKTEQSENYWYHNSYLIPEDVEDNPEFFEEIIQKDYEILSLLGLISNMVHLVDKNGDILTSNQNSVCDRGPAEKVVLKEPNRWKIHSIKRLSDGEVFTIGDLVIEDSLGMKTPQKITKIRIIGDAVAVNGDKFQTTLNRLQKAKTPLFVTEDGVEIYSRKSEVAAVWRDKHELRFDSIVYDDFARQCTMGNYLLFSSKEKAQEWIILNKPCLSIKDISPIIGKNLEYRNGGSYLDLDKLTEKFKELVKSKL